MIESSLLLVVDKLMISRQLFRMMEQ